METLINTPDQSSRLQKIMTYDLQPILKRFAKDNQMVLEELESYGTELKKFLAICALFPEREHNVYSEVVDDLWHTFIWHTPLYVDFCRNIIGKYLHHQPTDLNMLEQEGQESDHAITSSEDYFEDAFYLDYIQLFGDVPPRNIWNGLYSSKILSADCKGSRSPASCKKINIETDWSIFVD